MSFAVDASRVEWNREAVQKMYDLANSGNIDAMLELWADDIVLVEADSHPFPGVWKGKEAVQGALPGVIASLNMIRNEVVDWIAGEGCVGARIKIFATDKEGTSFEIDCCELCTINEEGKISEIRSFYHDMYELRNRLGCDD